MLDVSSKQILKETHPHTLTQYPNEPKKLKSTKKNEKRNVRHFFKANSERNPTHTLTQYPKETRKPKSTKKNEKRNISMFFQSKYRKKPTPHTYLIFQRDQEAEIYKKRMKKETLNVSSKQILKEIHFTHLPNIPKRPGSWNLQKRMEKETLDVSSK